MPQFEVETVRRVIVEAEDEEAARAAVLYEFGGHRYKEGALKRDDRAFFYRLKAFPGGISSIYRANQEMRC